MVQNVVAEYLDFIEKSNFVTEKTEAAVHKHFGINLLKTTHGGVLLY